MRQNCVKELGAYIMGLWDNNIMWPSARALPIAIQSPRTGSPS